MPSEHHWVGQVSSWHNVFQVDLKAFPPRDPKCSHGWEYLSTKQIIQIGLQMWKWHNKHVHGKTLKEKHAKDHETALIRVGSDYSQQHHS